MLKVFRDNLKYLSWVLWLVIAVFVVFVFADFGSIQPGANQAEAAAATVGREKVSYEEFQQAYRQAEENYRRAYGDQFNSELAHQLGLRRQVLEGLVVEKILLAEGKRIGLEVPDSELQKEILTYPAFQNASDNFDEETYQQLLRRNGLTPTQFEDQVRSSLMTTKVRSVLAQNIYISDEEVESRFREREEQARVRFLKLSTATFGDTVAIQESDLEQYFGEHSQEFEIPERRIVQYLQIDRAVIQSTLEIGNDEIQRFYDDNLSQFTREEQIRARHILLLINDERTAEAAASQMQEIRARIERGEDFAAVAAEVSEDPGSKEGGGDLGFFGRGAMVPEFEEAAFSASPGEIVGPIQSPFGSHLIETLERRPGGSQSLEEASGLIRGRLMAERSETVTESKAQELVGRIRAEQIADELGLSALAEGESGVTYQVSSPFGRNDNVPGIGRASAFSVASFGLDLGTTGDPVKTPRGWVIPRLLDIEAPRLPDLNEVRPQVESALRSERRASLALQRLDDARLEIGGGSGSLDALAEELGVEVEDSELFALEDPVGSLGRAPSVAAAALALDQGAIGGPISVGDDAVLFEVVERVRFDPTKFEEAREATRDELLNRRFTELLATLVEKRREELDVRFDPQLVESFELGAES